MIALLVTVWFTSHTINECPVGAVHLVGEYEAKRNDGSQHGRFLSFNSTEDTKTRRHQ